MKIKPLFTPPFFTIAIASLLTMLLWSAYAVLHPYTTFRAADKMQIFAGGFFLALPLMIILNTKYFKTKLADRPLLWRVLWVLVFALIISYPIRNAINVLFDYSTPQELIVRVERRTVFHGKTIHYELTMKDAFLGPELQTLEVEYPFFKSVKVGDYIAIQAHSGALGMRWSSGIRKTVPAQ